MMQGEFSVANKPIRFYRNDGSQRISKWDAHLFVKEPLFAFIQIIPIRFGSCGEIETDRFIYYPDVAIHSEDS